MRILINAECVKGARAGVGHYTGELVNALRRGGRDTVDTYPAAVLSAAFIRHWTRQNQRCVASRGRAGPLARVGGFTRHAYLAALRRVSNLVAPHLLDPNPFGHYARRGGYDLYHEPNFLPHPCDWPTVVTVHDLSALLYPQWHPPLRVALFEKQFRTGLEFATHLVAISEFGKQEIVRHLGWPPDRVSVTYMGVRPGLRPVGGDALTRGLRALRLSPGYLLHVGTVEPRKNLPMLLRAYAGLPAAVRERHPLVLAGGRGWQSEAVHDYLQTDAKGRNVRWLGYVNDEHVPALYSGARALVFPTFYEGFGMPTIEMMACGGAVLASTAAAVAETVGGKAHLIDPHDEGGWRDAMLRVCTDADWWRALKSGAEDVARPYTWERCAEQTRQAYGQALGQESGVKRAA